MVAKFQCSKEVQGENNLFTLFPHLDGVVIVDRPGVGESDIMDEIFLN